MGTDIVALVIFSSALGVLWINKPRMRSDDEEPRQPTRAPVNENEAAEEAGEAPPRKVRRFLLLRRAR